MIFAFPLAKREDSVWATHLPSLSSLITSMSRVRITQQSLMHLVSPPVLTTHAVPLKLTTTQTIITAGKLMEVTDNLNSADVAEASSLRNELLALMVLLCLLILGVVIYFVFRSMVYIKKVSFWYL